MRVHLIRRETVAEFMSDHAGSRASLSDWLEKIRWADWTEPGHICWTFGAADLLGNGSNRVVFNISGNSYRMICKYVFGESQVHLFVCWIGSHADYTSLCRRNEQFVVSRY
jgi:mRNA interferase HigB